MTLIDFCRSAMGVTGPGPSDASACEVHDELMFHFRALVNEKIAEGLSFEAAWEQAEKQFGPVRRYENECHAVQVERRLKWLLASAAAFVLVMGYGAWRVFWSPQERLSENLQALRDEVQAFREEHVQRTAQVATVSNEAAPHDPIDLNGIVLAADGQPLPDATVLVILKTWPGGRYLQESFTAASGADGKFHLPELIPWGGQYAILVTALKDGFAFQSDYQMKDTRPFTGPDPIALRLQPATHVLLTVRDANGHPLSNVPVFPSERKSQTGQSHLVYFQGSEPIHRMTDAEGRIRFDCFSVGDHAEVYLQLPGDDWNNRKFRITKDDEVINLASTVGVPAPPIALDFAFPPNRQGADVTQVFSFYVGLTR